MFETPLVVREAERERLAHWVLEAPLRYDAKFEALEVPAGFGTDFASVPRILWPIFPPYGRHTKAAVLHDWLYREQPEVWSRRGFAHRGPISRADADGIFRRTMRDLGVSRWRRALMWLGVRAGGWTSWRRARRAIERR